MRIFFSQPEFDTQLLRAISYTHSGGAEIGECLTTAARIKDGDFDSWYEEWMHTGDRIYKEGETSAAGRHFISARDCYLRASNYYRAAYFYLFGAPVNPKLLEAYERHEDSFNKAVKLFETPVQVVQIPYEGTFLPGYFYKFDNSLTPSPTIITGTGYDGTQQESYFSTVYGALKRRYNVLTFDGPGQGKVLLKQQLYMRPDWEKVITPVVDFLLKRPEVDPSRISLVGQSWGGMLASRAAAYEHRLSALVVNPGQFDAMDGIRRFFPHVEEHLSKNDHKVLDEVLCQVLNDRMMSKKFQAKMWVHGVPTAVDLLKEWQSYKLEGIAQNILCSTLVCDSESEPLSSGQAKRLFDALQCPKQYLLFKNSEGAGEHCAAGALSLCEQRLFDWLDNQRVLQVANV